jgi:glyoxylase-like metal-dependent hydrolase (beta-lactamase superfamily II)
MTAIELRSRRTFLADLGRGTFAIAVVGMAGCGSAASPSPAASPAASPGPSPSASAGPSAAPASPSALPSGASGATTWQRVSLGFVSAYILVRAGEAAVVDTGVAGSEVDIEAGLGAVALGWDSVGHVIVTHLHADHAGGAAAVLTAAAGATGYAGAADIPAIAVPRPLTPVADGDLVFGLRIIATPGHTAGHIAVLDEAGGVLVAGDALTTNGGGVAGPSAQFTDDMVEATASVAKLGTFSFETLLVGHGDPITTGAAAQVRALTEAY